MLNILIWIYAVNATLIIVHEIDSAYWNEWKLFKLPGRIAFFLILHLFLIFIIVLGIILLFQATTAGLVLSIILSLAGILAFSLHTYFIKKGHPEFKTAISQSILISTLIVSLAQLIYTIYIFLAGYQD